MIQPPPNSGSTYYNYKGFHSIVLMAVANANYEFIYVDVGANGRISDGGVWNNCSLAKRLEGNEAELPAPRKSGNSKENLPFVFVADDAFAMKPYMMKPFPFRNQTNEQRIYSYRHSRARRVIENVFGILVKKFGIFQTAILLSPEKAVKVVLACVVLHNYMRREMATEYIGSADVDREQEENGVIVPGSWRNETNITPLERTNERNSSQNSKDIRNMFMNYFNNEGQVPWQNRMCGLN